MKKENCKSFNGERIASDKEKIAHDRDDEYQGKEKIEFTMIPISEIEKAVRACEICGSNGAGY